MARVSNYPPPFFRTPCFERLWPLRAVLCSTARFLAQLSPTHATFTCESRMSAANNRAPDKSQRQAQAATSCARALGVLCFGQNKAPAKFRPPRQYPLLHRGGLSIIGYYSAVLLLRENSFTTIAGAPKWFLDYLALHLSVPVEVGQRPDSRFGIVFQRGENWFGSLVIGNRVPAGLTPHVVAIARYYTGQGYEVLCEVRDVRQRPPDAYPWGSVRAAWRPYQDEIHAKTMRAGVGVIDAPPRSGKTLMAARAIDQLAQPTLYVAPAVAVVRQTYEVFVQHFGSDLVARVDGTATAAMRDLSKPIVIATTASAVTLPQEFFDTRQLLVVDEWHHAASETYHKLNMLARNTYYRLCFTGTYWRTGLDMLALEALCSNVIAKVEIADLVPKYLVEPWVCFVPYRQAAFSARDWREAYEKGIAECEGRNALVVRDRKSVV